MKRMISVSTVVILTVIILLYTQVQSFVPAGEQGKEAQQDSRNDTVAENGGAGNAEDEGSARDYADQPQEGEDTCPLTEEEREVLLAYAEYLEKFYGKNPDNADQMKFDLVYIDADDIPELAVILADCHAAGVRICVYNDGDVVDVGGFGSFGKCRFKPYANLIFSTYMGQGEVESFFYRIEGTESVEQQAFHSWPRYQGFQYIGEGYEVDGTRVSEEEYNEAFEKWDLEALDVWGYEDALFIKGIDNLYEELCRRYSDVAAQSRADEILRSSAQEEAAGWDDSGLEEWKQVYLTCLAKSRDAVNCTYSLIYVDDDDIPELLVDTGFEAGGCQILTYHDHILDLWQSNRLHVTYIERGNLICNSDGNFGYYYDDIFSIQDGKWVYVDGGTFGDGPDGIQLDENNELIFVYRWADEDVSKEEYEARLNAVYPAGQGVYPQKYYILDEIRSVLRTGDVASAGHRYEFVMEDVTWKEAEKLCQEKGGYLATITSQEEFERLQAQMISEDKTNVTFFVGANNERNDGAYRGYRWLEPGTENGYRMLELYNALFRFWLEGEPSYTGLTESGEKVHEDYVVLFYRKVDGRCYLNDVPNDILEAAPSYGGRVGYICEYDE